MAPIVVLRTERGTSSTPRPPRSSSSCPISGPAAGSPGPDRDSGAVPATSRPRAGLASTASRVRPETAAGPSHPPPGSSPPLDATIASSRRPRSTRAMAQDRAATTERVSSATTASAASRSRSPATVWVIRLRTRSSPSRDTSPEAMAPAKPAITKPTPIRNEMETGSSSWPYSARPQTSRAV